MISHPMDDPYSPAKADIRNFLKKSAAARRALSELGPNDPKANMRMAESLITITAEQFMKKWNFDPILFRPITPGRYLWTPVKTKKKARSPTTEVVTSLPSSSAVPFQSLEREVSTAALEDRLSGHHLSDAAVDYSATTTRPITTTKAMLEVTQPITTTSTLMSNILLTPKKSSSSSRTSATSKTKQCKITAYARQRKRLLSTSKSEEGVETDVLSPRKRLAMSPSKL